MEEEIQGFNIELNDARQSGKLADVNVILVDANRDDFKEISPKTRKAIIKSTLQEGYASLK
jgi:hypothetical protein